MRDWNSRNTSFAAIRLFTIISLTLLVFLSYSHCVIAEDNGLPEDYQPSESDNRDLSDNTGQNRYGIPWHQYKNILTSDTVDVQDITVLCEPEDDWYDPEPVEGISFRLYNSTTQENEGVITTGEDGILHMPSMKRGHTYILMADSDEYIISGAHNIYLWALGAGDQSVTADGAYEHKEKYIRLDDDDPVPDDYLDLFTEITVRATSGSFYDPMYFTMDLPVIYNGNPAPDGIKFRFTSAEEGTIEAVSRDGHVSADLIEDTDYTVHVDDDQYDIETFALTVKDKSEHKYLDTLGMLSEYGRYCYDHTCCQGADKLIIMDKDAVSHAGKISSLKTVNGKPQAVVTGMDFKTLLLLVRYLQADLPAGSGVTDYDIAELTLANPHRWEKCKITDTQFTVTQMLPQQRTVKGVYLLKDGKLENLHYTQKSKDSIIFETDSMSLYPVVIEYAASEPEVIPGTNPSAPAASDKKVSKPKGTSIKKLKAGRKKVTVTWKKQSKLTSGYQIQYGTKKNFKKAKKISVKGAKKTTRTIKKLKPGKKYYVRIRTYRIVNGKKYYSFWSKAKAVRVR